MAHHAHPHPHHTYKLVYFNGRGRGETTRLLFAEAQQKYTDERFDFKDWPTRKATTPYGQVPVLEVDGKQLAQRSAIENFVARKLNLHGGNDFEQAKVHEITEACADVFNPFVRSASNKDEAAKKSGLEEFFKTTLPTNAGALEAVLKSNGGGDGYFVGHNVTLADIRFYADFAAILGANATALDATPKLKALHARVAARPHIAAWLTARPQTPF